MMLCLMRGYAMMIFFDAFTRVSIAAFSCRYFDTPRALCRHAYHYFFVAARFIFSAAARLRHCLFTLFAMPLSDAAHYADDVDAMPLRYAFHTRMSLPLRTKRWRLLFLLIDA